MANGWRKFCKSKTYKYVTKSIDMNGKIHWRFRYGNTSKFYETEREAAIAADRFLISIGKEPVNILVRKQ
jgi:hypothetical protein